MDKITTPRGEVFTVRTKGGTLKAQLTWNAAAISRRNDEFTKAQKFVDSEVLRYCAMLAPLRTGMLIKSGTLGTQVGSGIVQYVAPYAAPQYYKTATSRPYDSNRGGKWFERMKTAYKEEILRGAGNLMS